jgi:hypothetical protein
MSPFSAPFSGAPPSERPLLPRRSRLHSGREPDGVREEPGKQKPRSAFFFHPAYGTAGAGIWPEAVPRKMSGRKRRGLLNWEDRCGIGRAM